VYEQKIKLWTKP